MHSLQTKIEKVKNHSKAYFTQQDFLQLFISLRPEFPLDDEQILQIFELKDEQKTGKIPKAVVEEILAAVLQSEENTDEQAGSTRGSTIINRQTIYLKNDKLSSNFLNELDIDKISELKQIFSICEGNKGYASLDQIKDFIANFHQLTFTPDQIMKIFSAIKEKGKNVVTLESFSNMMIQLESAILNQFDDEDYQGGFDDQQSNFKRNMESVMISEVGSDSDGEDDSKVLESYNSELVNEVQLIIQKVDEAVDALKNKAKPINVTTMLHDAISISSNLEKEVRKNEEKFKEIRKKVNNYKNVEELLNSKVGTLEINLRRQMEAMESIQNENDSLFQKNRALESQIKVNDHIQHDLQEKNTEIVRLERRLEESEKQRAELQKKVQHAEHEKDMIAENYKELEKLLKKEEERYAQEESNINMDETEKEKFYLEIDSLKFELKNMTAKKDIIEQEKFSFEKMVAELREHLSNSKEFLNVVRLEKNDLESQLKKLQSELENLRNNDYKAKRSSVGGDNLAKILGLGGDGMFESQSPMKTVKEDSQEESMFSPVALVAKNRETIESRKFDSLMESGFKYNATDNRFSVFDKSQEEIKEEPENRAFQSQAMEIPSFENPALTKQKSSKKGISMLDLRNLNQDYLSLRQNPTIIKILQKHKENLDEKICFSDYMYRINSRENREHRALFITGEALYSLHPRKGYQVIRRIPLDKIYRITISKSSAGLCAIHVHNDYDYLIDIYKRLNLILFLQTCFRFKQLKQFSIKYEQSFFVKERGATTTKQIDPVSKAVANPELQSTYKHAQKFGELYVKTWGLFNPWTPYFFILTELGFISFSKLGSSKPIEFYPVIGYLIIDKPGANDGKYAFKVKFPHSDFEVSLATDSEIEKNSWIKEIKRIQEAAQRREKEKSKEDVTESIGA